jgi:L-ascorbate metabolism protein UlaG (beta-lactamase superfamily)
MLKRLAVLAVAALGWSSAPSLAAETQITWHGHATFEVVTPKGAVLVIDPWLNNPKNPAAAGGKNPLAPFKRVDYILLTHAHTDHIADAAELARKTGAQLVAMPELGRQMVQLRAYPQKQFGMATMMNMGGEIRIAGGEVRVAMTDAKHSGGMDNPAADNDPKAPAVVYAGNPAGFVIRIEGGPAIYHTGDTDYFADMQYIGERYAPDVALLSAGDHFTMGPTVAARAAKAVQARLAVPMHWGTFPVLAQDMKAFTTEAKRLGVATRVIAPGETLVFEGARLKP